MQNKIKPGNSARKIGQIGAVALLVLLTVNILPAQENPAGPTITEDSSVPAKAPPVRRAVPQASLLKNIGSSEFFSPSVGEKFYELAYELGNSNSVTTSKAEQAVTFLLAVWNLETRADYILPELLKVISQNSLADYSEIVWQMLPRYVDERADLTTARASIRYLLEDINTRQQREQFLRQLFQRLNGKNSFLESDIATEIALLKVEKTDEPNAIRYLMVAHQKNPYNKLAFEKLRELAPTQIHPAAFIEHMRLRLRKNRFDLDTALQFARTCESLQLFDASADAYQYCTNLFRLLYPEQPLPASIYLPWAATCYNTERELDKCLQISEQVRNSGQFDLLLETYAAKAARKLANPQQAEIILGRAEKKALNNYRYHLGSQDSEKQILAARSLAWFYCFAGNHTNNALDWANRVYSIDSNSPTNAAILAYALVLNNQNELAAELISNHETTPVAKLALAKIQLTKGQKSDAVQNLRDVVAAEPTSLEAQTAKQILQANDAEYIPSLDPALILTALNQSFGTKRTDIVPEFVTPEKLISYHLNLRGTRFSYGKEFQAELIITNKSSEPVIIADDAMLQGNVRIDAVVSGDIEEKIPELLSFRTQPGFAIDAGKSFVKPLRLMTGRLREILTNHPQASLEIEFRTYLDPVNTGKGSANYLAQIPAAVANIERPGLELSAKFLQNRLNVISKGREEQKKKILYLFTGLLKEQNIMANREPSYNFKYADWMPDMLKSALIHDLDNADWTVRANAMADMISLPPDYQLTRAISNNLNDENHWPCRLIALYILSNTGQKGFEKVLNYTAQQDKNLLVRTMAVALGGTPRQRLPAANQPTKSQPNTNESEPPAEK